MDPAVGYAHIGEDRIAYQVIGDGPIDFVLTTGWWGAFDVEWEDPAIRLFYQELGHDARVIHFDRRGSGASDPIAIDALPPWESFAEEIEAVMDAVGSDKATIVGAGSAGPAALFFAATRPERTTALVLYQTTARYLEADGYPEGLKREEVMEAQAEIRQTWGTGEILHMLMPSRAGNERFSTWYAKVQRSITSPRAIQALQESELEIDARSLLPNISVPTLVIHRTDSPVSPLAWGRYLADNIEGARLVELPGGDVAPYWENPEQTLDAIHEFMTGITRQPRPMRQLATVLFTDIVDSTARAESLGDRRWLSLLELHDTLSREVIEDHSGRLIKNTGDGHLATFEGPGRAIRAAKALKDGLSSVQIEIRAGIHTGEIEVRLDDVSGLAVHLTARIMGLANAGEILVSRTVRDLVVGSSIRFRDRGFHSLKGIKGEWQLYALDSITSPAGHT